VLEVEPTGQQRSRGTGDGFVAVSATSDKQSTDVDMQTHKTGSYMWGLSLAGQKVQGPDPPVSTR